MFRVWVICRRAVSDSHSRAAAHHMHIDALWKDAVFLLILLPVLFGGPGRVDCCSYWQIIGL